MANDCRPQIQACAMRVARLYSTGVPAVGSQNHYVTDALVSLKWSTEIEDGEEIQVKNACGSLIVNSKDCDRLKWVNIELSLATPDPELSEILVGGTRLVDAGAIGYAFPALNLATCPNGVSIELWAKRVTAGGGLDATNPYAWWAIPRVYLNWNDATFENGAFQPTIQGFAVENENWSNGPLNDWPVASTRVMQWIPDNGIPTPSCGYRTTPAS